MNPRNWFGREQQDDADVATHCRRDARYEGGSPRSVSGAQQLEKPEKRTPSRNEKPMDIRRTQEQKCNNAKLANMLQSNDHIDDDANSGDGEEESIAVRSYSDRQNLLGLTRLISARSIERRRSSNGSVDGTCETSSTSSSTYFSRRSSNNKTSPLNLRSGSLRRSTGRTSSQRYHANTISSSFRGDDCVKTFGRTSAIAFGLPDNKDETADDKAMPPSTTSNRNQSNKSLREEDWWVANFEQIDVPVRTATVKSVPHQTVELPPARVIDERSLVNSPALRRAKSTSAIETVQSILKTELFGTSQPRGLKRENSVRFDRVEMREFDRTIGDNPSVSCGVPIGLDWKYNPKIFVQDLEDYESNRKPRLSRYDLALTPYARRQMLLRQWSISYQELCDTAKETDSIRQQRLESAAQKPKEQKREEMLETTKRRLCRVFTGRKKKEQERLWKKAQIICAEAQRSPKTKNT